MQKNTIALAVAFTLSAGATITPGSSAYAQQPDPIDERIKKLEDQLQAVTQELTRLKEEAAAQKQRD